MRWEWPDRSGKIVAMQNDPDKAHDPVPPAEPAPARRPPEGEAAREIGGPAGPEPTRYGDWEKAGRCIDF